MFKNQIIGCVATDVCIILLQQQQYSELQNGKTRDFKNPRPFVNIPNVEPRKGDFC